MRKRVNIDAIRSCVKERGVFFEWLAKESGMTQNAMTLSMNGKRELKANEYAGICDALGVALDTFLV